MPDFEIKSPPLVPWLSDYLDEAVAKNMCTRVGCTTCGAIEFRQGLCGHAARSAGLPIGLRPDLRIVSELIGQLALLTPDPGRQQKWFDAVRLIFCDFVSPLLEMSVGQRLEGAWAGSVLRAMQAHSRIRREALRQHDLFNSQEAVEARREQKRRLKQQAHAERLTKKKEQDRLWFEKHPRNQSQDPDS